MHATHSMMMNCQCKRDSAENCNRQRESFSGHCVRGIPNIRGGWSTFFHDGMNSHSSREKNTWLGSFTASSRSMVLKLCLVSTFWNYVNLWLQYQQQHDLRTRLSYSTRSNCGTNLEECRGGIPSTTCRAPRWLHFRPQKGGSGFLGPIVDQKVCYQNGCGVLSTLTTSQKQLFHHNRFCSTSTKL